jgi:dienelactone hydrolase
MIIKHILPAILAAAFALVVGPAQADLKRDWVEYSHGGMKLKGYLVHDDRAKAKRPAVLMIHSKAGMTKNAQRLADNWANSGFAVFAADIFGFGQGILPKDAAEQSAQTAIYTKDRPLMRARTKAGFDTLASLPLVVPSRIALIGYCFGGAVGVEFGSTGAPLAANVAIHGSFRSHAEGWAKNIKGRFLILHGAEDINYSLATAVTPVIEELRAAKVPFQLEVYSGTGHGFSAPKNKDEERSNEQSIASTVRTLREVFGD